VFEDLVWNNPKRRLISQWRGFPNGFWSIVYRSGAAGYRRLNHGAVISRLYRRASAGSKRRSGAKDGEVSLPSRGLNRILGAAGPRIALDRAVRFSYAGIQ
jgi:hypothetical protein